MTSQGADPSESPSLCSAASDVTAFELKFLLDASAAAAVEGWARRSLKPDPHGDHGTYRTTTLYLDTAGLDVYFKSPGYRRSKYRVRYYAGTPLVHVERKRRQGDRVRKWREAIPTEGIGQLLEPDGPAGWFGERVRDRQLGPSCWLTYTRTAFFGMAVGEPIRLTLDREVSGMPAADWAAPAPFDGRRLVADQVILELKYRVALPPLFRDLLGLLPAQVPGGSKYGRCIEAWGLARGSADA
ncbi:MAG: polyphosphate polymerase domain-containing protein [Gemmataceae bacterium]